LIKELKYIGITNIPGTTGQGKDKGARSSAKHNPLFQLARYFISAEEKGGICMAHLGNSPYP